MKNNPNIDLSQKAEVNALRGQRFFKESEGEKYMGKGHKPGCKCRFCGGKGNVVEVKDDMTQIKGWSRHKCEDELASLRYQILSRVAQLSRYWSGLCEMNKRKEKIQERLAELGVNIKDQ